jgi:L-malate glycosyltransferase
MRVVILGNYPTFPFSDILSVPYEARKISTWLIYLCKYLSKYPGIELHVVTEDEYLREDKHFVSDKITFHYLKCPKKYKAATLFIGDVWRMRRMLKLIAPDVINAHHTDEFALTALYSGFPYVITVHGILSRFIPPGKFLSREKVVAQIEKHILRHARYLIASSPFVYEAVGKMTKAKFYDVENCLEEVYFEQIKDYSSNHEVVFIGHVIEDKGVQYLLEAISVLKNEFPSIRARIVGPFSPYEQHYAWKLQEYVKNHNLHDHIVFEGFVSSEKKIEIVKNAAVLVHPSRLETFCLSVAEAMAIGTPVVASRVGGLPFTVGGEDNALLVEYGSVEQIVKSIGMLLRSRELRQAYGQKGQKQARDRFHPSIVVPQLVHVFKEITAQG